MKLTTVHNAVNVSDGRKTAVNLSENILGFQPHWVQGCTCQCQLKEFDEHWRRHCPAGVHRMTLAGRHQRYIGRKTWNLLSLSHSSNHTGEQWHHSWLCEMCSVPYNYINTFHIQEWTLAFGTWLLQVAVNCHITRCQRQRYKKV